MAQSFILNCPPDCNPNVATLVSRFILDNAEQVHLVGPECCRVETLLNQTLKGSGFNLHIALASFEGESLASVVAFSRAYGRPHLGEPKVLFL